MNTQSPHKKPFVSQSEKMIAEKLNRSLTQWARERESEAQQHFLRRWLGTISVFRWPLGVIGLAGVVIVSYRFISPVLGNVILAVIAGLIGCGFMYAAFLCLADALGGDGYAIWSRSFSSLRRALPSRGDISFERFGLLIGAVMYIMLGLVSLLAAYGLLRDR